MAETPPNELLTDKRLERTLLELEECRANGNLVEVGKRLLYLRDLVIWVGSDTATPPFWRAQELALEALQVFREANNIRGQVLALVAATTLTGPETRDKFLAEADALAEATDDETMRAVVLEGRARNITNDDAQQSIELQCQALAIYRRVGNKSRQARTLFSLAVANMGRPERCDYALEAAQLHRELGEHSSAARSVVVALSFTRPSDSSFDRAELAQQGLADAVAANHPGLIKQLTRIVAEIKSPELIEKRNADGGMKRNLPLTLEEKQSRRSLYATLIAIEEVRENTEKAAYFRGVLERLESAD